MAIRLPLQGIFDTTHTNQGTTSVAGGWAYDFKIPQDTDNVVVKVTPSVTAGGVSVIFQTSDDGGNTYYDVARTSIASQNELGKAPQWLSIPTIGNGYRTAATFAGASIITAGIGSASASTLGSQQVSGIPILGLQNRVFLISTGNATAISARIQVLVNNQSATA
jgi:hypothetical protein